MKANIFLSLISLLLLSSCATESKYQNFLNSLVGESEYDLISEWGPPDSVYTLSDSEKIFTYKMYDNFYIAETPPTYKTRFVGKTAYTTSYGGTPSQNILTWCNTFLTIKNSKIVRWSYKGNSCVHN